MAQGLVCRAEDQGQVSPKTNFSILFMLLEKLSHIWID